MNGWHSTVIWETALKRDLFLHMKLTQYLIQVPRWGQMLSLWVLLIQTMPPYSQNSTCDDEMEMFANSLMRTNRKSSNLNLNSCCPYRWPCHAVGVVVSFFFFFDFHPYYWYLGQMIRFDEYIFQWGWFFFTNMKRRSETDRSRELPLPIEAWKVSTYD